MTHPQPDQQSDQQSHDGGDGPFAQLLAANRTYASTFDLGGLAAPAAKRFCLVTCMDSRIEPLVALGLVPGDAKILRNAGGRVTADVLRSLVLATTYLGVTAVAIMHHTDCAMTHLDGPGIQSALSADQRAATEGWDFLTMADADAALADDVAAAGGCAGLVAGTAVAGWRYDVGTGRIAQVVAPLVVGA